MLSQSSFTPKTGPKARSSYSFRNQRDIIEAQTLVLVVSLNQVPSLKEKGGIDKKVEFLKVILHKKEIIRSVDKKITDQSFVYFSSS
jgi:hypothetical protein